MDGRVIWWDEIHGGWVFSAPLSDLHAAVLPMLS
jgi:hypothetical protein